jgi:hypothetical protein
MLDLMFVGGMTGRAYVEVVEEGEVDIKYGAFTTSRCQGHCLDADQGLRDPSRHALDRLETHGVGLQGSSIS